MIRLVIVISLLIGGLVYGGLWGAFLAMCILTCVGMFFPGGEHKERMPSEPNDKMWEKVETARRGTNVDPTRPDDHPLLLTHEIKRRR